MNLLNANMRMLLIMSCAIFCNKIKSCCQLVSFFIPIVLI